jgi:hypothetical protein
MSLNRHKDPTREALLSLHCTDGQRDVTALVCTSRDSIQQPGSQVHPLPSAALMELGRAPHHHRLSVENPLCARYHTRTKLTCPLHWHGCPRKEAGHSHRTEETTGSEAEAVETCPGAAQVSGGLGLAGLFQGPFF